MLLISMYDDATVIIPTIGVGDENGGIRTRIYNHDNKDITILYMEVVPWYFRLYLHTFKILCNKNSTKNSKSSDCFACLS